MDWGPWRTFHKIEEIQPTFLVYRKGASRTRLKVLLGEIAERTWCQVEWDCENCSTTFIILHKLMGDLVKIPPHTNQEITASKHMKCTSKMLTIFLKVHCPGSIFFAEFNQISHNEFAIWALHPPFWRKPGPGCLACILDRHVQRWFFRTTRSWVMCTWPNLFQQDCDIIRSHPCRVSVCEVASPGFGSRFYVTFLNFEEQKFSLAIPTEDLLCRGGCPLSDRSETNSTDV